VYNFSGILGQEGLEGKQIVAFDDQIAFAFVRLIVKLGYFFKGMIGNGQVMIPDYVFAFELERGHNNTPFNL
jgi:hypothetical protein